MMAIHRLHIWGHLQAKALRLEAVCVLLAGTTAGLALLTGWLVTRPAPIYYLPASVGPGLLRPGEVPDTLAVDFAQQLVLLLGNVTPATATDAHAAVAKYLHPQLLLAFQTQMAREREVLRTDEMATQLAVRAATVTTPGMPRTVTVTALRRIYVGKTPIRDEEVQAMVTLLPVVPSPLNPYGLVVTALQLTPPLVPADARAATLSRR
jgi:hypothetical protein